MPISCCAIGCTNRQGYPGKRFFSFPKNKEQRGISAIKRDKWAPSAYSKICSDHFVTGKCVNFRSYDLCK